MAQGRQAHSPTKIPAGGWKDILLRVKNAVAADNIGLVAAGVAFYGLLALFPAITALVALLGLITDPGMLTSQVESLGSAIPADVRDIILDQITAVAGADAGGLSLAAILGLLLALYSASRGVDSLMRGLNIAFNESEDRGLLQYYATVLILTLGLIIGVVLAVAVVAALPAVFAFMDRYPDMKAMIMLIRWPFLLAVAALGFTILYRFGPSRDPARWRWLAPGSILACILWVAASFGFTWYVENFASYNETFGTLAGVIVLLMWLWLSAYIILIGAELDGEIEAQTKRDSTTGPPEPMGERGAVKADNLGESAG